MTKCLIFFLKREEQMFKMASLWRRYPKRWIFNCSARIIKNDTIFLQWVCVIKARKFPSEDNFRARGSASDPIFAPLFRNCMTYEVSWFSGGFTSLRNFQLAKIYKRRAKWGSSIKNRNGLLLSSRLSSVAKLGKNHNFQLQRLWSSKVGGR